MNEIEKGIQMLKDKVVQAGESLRLAEKVHRSNPIRKGNKVVSAQSILREITERKNVEKDLAHERDLLHALMDNIPDAIYFKDVNCRFTRVNRAHAWRMGLNDPKEAVGKTDFDFYPTDFAREAYADEQRIVETGKALINKIEKIRKRDGEPRWVSATKAPIISKEGRVTGLVGISRDITEGKQAEEALAYERDLLHALMNNIPDAIYFKDAKSRFTRTNKAHAQMIGVADSKAAIGKTDFDFYAEEFAREAYADEQEIVKTGKPMVNKIEKIRRTNGFFQWVSASKVPITDEIGRVIGIVGISRDVTERKRMEEDLRRYSEHLEELVEEKTRKLRESERLAAIGETAAMVGHDLRNPLQVISNLLYLEKKMLSEVPLQLREIAEKKGIEDIFRNMAEQIKYMNKIVSDLQDYARPVKPEFVETSVHQLINETLSTVMVPETVEVSKMIPEDLPRLMADPALMKRVFTNLITNAFQAMPNGGQLTIKAHSAEEAMFISLQDTGVGVPEENLPKLFQPLFTTKPKGTGFGLPVCKRLVEAHDGNITVESRVGKGSTFTVRLPLRKEVS